MKDCDVYIEKMIPMLIMCDLFDFVSVLLPFSF